MPYSTLKNTWNNTTLPTNSREISNAPAGFCNDPNGLCKWCVDNGYYGNGYCNGGVDSNGKVIPVFDGTKCLHGNCKKPGDGSSDGCDADFECDSCGGYNGETGKQDGCCIPIGTNIPEPPVDGCPPGI